MKIIIALISILICSKLLGQMIPYRYYNTGNGLIQSQVTALTQDQKGFIWIGTPGGLNKFDGKRFVRFTERDGLTEDWVTTLTTDTKGNIWIGHWGGGITVYDNNAGYLRTVKSNKSIKKAAITKLISDSETGIWAVNQQGELFYYSDLLSEPKNISISNGLAKPAVNDFVISSNWGFAATNKGLVLINLKVKDCAQLKFSNELDLSVISGLAVVNSSLICLTESGKFFEIIKLKDKYIAKELSVPGLGSEVTKQIKKIYSSSGNTFWASSKNIGAVKFTLKDKILLFEIHDFAHGLSYNESNIIFEDKENTIWIGTNAGLNHYLGNSFKTINEWNGLPDNMVEDLLVNQGNIYAATTNGLSIIDKEKLLVIKNIKLENLKSLTLVNNKLYCSNNQSVYELLNENLKPVVNFPFEITGIRAYNNQLYIATGNGIYLFRNNRSELILEGNFYRINSGVSGIYCANVQGEIYLINEQIKKLPYNELERELILAIKEDENKNLWLSTYHSGIFKIGPDKKIYNYQLNDDNYNYIPFSIVLDKNYLWAGTNRGILRLNLSNKKFLVFDEHDGFEGVEANANAIFKDNENIYFGTIMGICVFNTTFADRLKNLPKPFIKSVLTFPDNIPVKNTDRIKANNNNIKIEFSAISSLWSKKAEYTYRLLGQDSNWINTHAEEIWFRQLKPGTYIFELQTRVADITNTTETARIKFYIKPPYYKTSWFLGICLICLGGGLYLIIKNRSRKLYLEKLELEGRVLELNNALREKESELKNLRRGA